MKTLSKETWRSPPQPNTRRMTNIVSVHTSTKSSSPELHGLVRRTLRSTPRHRSTREKVTLRHEKTAPDSTDKTNRRIREDNKKKRAGIVVSKEDTARENHPRNAGLMEIN